ncbi:MAG: hypothetical protein RSC68_34535 [Acinetobacter sp.]
MMHSNSKERDASELNIYFLHPQKHVSFAFWLRKQLEKGDALPVILVERLEIQADSKSEAIDFVKQALIDIAAESIGVKNPDELGPSFRDGFAAKKQPNDR